MKAAKLQVHASHAGSDSFPAHELFKDLVHVTYFNVLKVEIIRVDRPRRTQKYAFMTLANQRSKDTLLACKIQVANTSLNFVEPNPLERRISETNKSDARIGYTTMIQGICNQPKVTQAVRNMIGSEIVTYLLFGTCKDNTKSRHVLCTTT